MYKLVNCPHLFSLVIFPNNSASFELHLVTKTTHCLDIFEWIDGNEIIKVLKILLIRMNVGQH
jgi:hypothetical protein